MLQEQDHISKRDVKQEQRQRALRALKKGQRVAIDLSLEQHMSDKVRHSNL